jgi:hypothetical protein
VSDVVVEGLVLPLHCRLSAAFVSVHRGVAPSVSSEGGLADGVAVFDAVAVVVSMICCA